MHSDYLMISNFDKSIQIGNIDSISPSVRIELLSNFEIYRHRQRLCIKWLALALHKALLHNHRLCMQCCGNKVKLLQSLYARCSLGGTNDTLIFEATDRLHVMPSPPIHLTQYEQHHKRLRLHSPLAYGFAPRTRQIIYLPGYQEHNQGVCSWIKA